MKSNSKILNLIINSEKSVEPQSENIVALWALKFLLKLGGMKRFMDDGRIRYDDISEYLGLHVWFDDEDKLEEALERFAPEGYRGKHETLSKKLVVESLESLMAKLEKSKCTTSPILERNIAKLANLISLNTVEQDILRMTVYLKYYDVLTESSRTLGELTIEQIYKVLSVILSTPKEVIREALMPRSRLNRSGIVSIDRYNNSSSLSNKIEVASNGFVEKMMSCDEEDIEAIIKDSVRRCSPGTLTLDSYNHLDAEVSTMLGYLNKAFEHNIPGVNILLYGQPGTGKTELVKTLATHMGIELFEVSFADDDDDPISGNSRLKAYRTAQTLLKNKTAMLMFDEIEDVFKDDDNSHFGRRKSSNTKAWMNRILENNSIPAIWITNKVYIIDNAFIRRFDMVYEIPIPPKIKRQEIISTHAGSMVSEETLKRVATHENISPAIITRAAKVVSAISESAEKSSATFESLINNTIKAQGWRGLDEKNGPTLPKSYDPSFVNTSINLKELLDGIRYAGSARICFYGVPGTGKSAFGQYLANELDKPFILKKGSDLMSKWVGGTEKNIARAFKEAMEEKAVLVFDEVDSFLQDRRSARASWEVTQVNEMLVQMENYEGIFIATTNLMDGLDQASLRRFDLKLEFGYLKPQQALELFTKEAMLMGIDTISRTVENDLKSLSRLAPGDFAAIRRQSRFSPIKTADDLFDRLYDEVKIKQQDDSKRMGFFR